MLILKFKVGGIGYDTTNGDCKVENGERVIGHSHPSLTRIIEIGCVCNNVEILNGTIIGQPTEGALMVLAVKVK